MIGRDLTRMTEKALVEVTARASRMARTGARIDREEMASSLVIKEVEVVDNMPVADRTSRTGRIFTAGTLVKAGECPSC